MVYLQKEVSFEKKESLICIEVYKWIVLALSISSDFWLRWLVHEACHGIRAQGLEFES
jgi:hypothetical protein